MKFLKFSFSKKPKRLVLVCGVDTICPRYKIAAKAAHSQLPPANAFIEPETPALAKLRHFTNPQAKPQSRDQGGINLIEGRLALYSYPYASPKRQFEQLLFPMIVHVQNPYTAQLIRRCINICVEYIHFDGVCYYFLIPGKSGPIEAPASDFSGFTQSQLRRLIGEEFVPIPILEGLKLKFCNPKTANFMRKLMPSVVNDFGEFFARAVKVKNAQVQAFRSRSGQELRAENFRGSWHDRQIAELVRTAMQLPH